MDPASIQKGLCDSKNQVRGVGPSREAPHQPHPDHLYDLDFDLHYGDGTVNILRDKGYAAILNPQTENRAEYLQMVEKDLSRMQADMVAVSAGFDAHQLGLGRYPPNPSLSLFSVRY